MMQERFENHSDFGEVKGNVVTIDTETDFTGGDLVADVDSVITSAGDFKKLVYGCQASGSKLPFKDAYFDAYVSNMVLQLIDDPHA